MTEPLLRVDDIHTFYGESHILQGVSLEIARGGVVSLMGRNGAGKTTTLRSIVQLTPPRSGAVTFDGASLAGRKTYEIAQAGLALVPETRGIFPSLSVEENLRIGGYRLARNEVPGRTEVLYRQFPRLAERRRQRVRTMSGGERQMLALARALMTGPELLMLDEPSAALSPRMAGEIFDQVAAINAEGTTLVIVEQEAQDVPPDGGELLSASGDERFGLLEGRLGVGGRTGGVGMGHGISTASLFGGREATRVI